MKRMKNILMILIAVSFVFAGCLKDKEYEKGARGASIDKNLKVIEIAGPLDGFVNVDLVGSNTDTTANIVLVRLASEKVAEKEIQITMVADASVVDDFNTANGTHYQVPLPSQYTFPSLVVRIPKGSRAGYLRLTTKPNSLFGGEYALGLKLLAVSEPGIVLSQNFNKQVVGLTIRNKYDGSYTMTGSFIDLAVPTIVAKSPAEVQLVTTGTNSVYLHNSGAGNAGWLDLFPIINGVESAYGSFTPEFTFDANNNVTAVVNAYGQPASNTRSAAIDPSGINKWDPATRTLKVKWFMYQPSVIAGVRTSFDFTFTYTGSR
jgi:hypothetical protein